MFSMAIMPRLRQQNAGEDTERYGARKLSAVLSEVQTRNAYQRKTTEYVSYQRARRKDAEPITRNPLSADYRLFLFN